MSDDKGDDYGHGPCSTPDCGGDGWAVLNDGTVQCVGCFNAYFGGTNTATNTTTDQPAHYTAGSVEVIDTIREALGEAGFRAFCRGNVIKYALRAGKKGDFAEDMRKAANYARWASGEEWRPGRGGSEIAAAPQATSEEAEAADAASDDWAARDGPPAACNGCGKVCVGTYHGVCCRCCGYDDAPAACEHCARRALDDAEPKCPPHVADILGHPVTVVPSGGPWKWRGCVDVPSGSAASAWADTATDLRARLIASIRASGVMVPGE